MRNIYLLLFCFLPTLTIFAQEKNNRTEIKNYFDFKAGETAYLFGDKVNIRADASTKAKVLKTLSFNTPIKILTVLPEDMHPYLTLNGITAPWVKIQFGKKLIDGYVWAPLLAQYRIESAFYVNFLFGLSRKDAKTGQLYGKLRAIKEGSVLDEIEFKAIGDEGHHTYGKIYGNRGLSKVDNIIETHFGYEACGYANGQQIFTWHEEQLHYLGEDSGVADGGIFFGGTSIIFPEDDRGQHGKILFKKENGEFDDIGNGTIKTEISVWDWTGKKLVKATAY